MKHVTSIVVALLGLAALAPAQLRLEGTLGRHVTASARTVAQPSRGIVSGSIRVTHDHDRYGSRNRGRSHDHGHDHGHRHGHVRYRIVHERVWVPGYYTTEFVPATYGWVRDECGRRVWGVVRPACDRRVFVPGRYEVRQRRVRC